MPLPLLEFPLGSSKHRYAEIPYLDIKSFVTTCPPPDGHGSWDQLALRTPTCKRHAVVSAGYILFKKSYGALSPTQATEAHSNSRDVESSNALLTASCQGNSSIVPIPQPRNTAHPSRNFYRLPQTHIKIVITMNFPCPSASLHAVEASYTTHVIGDT